jgi:hypothetical protein
MPLTATIIRPVPDAERKAVGFWMNDGPQGPVRVFVSYLALWELEPAKLPDVLTALELFAVNRLRIEEAASAKFDRDGVDEDDRHEDRPVLTVRLGEIP